MGDNAIKVFAVLSDLLANHVGEEPALGYAEELGERLGTYVVAVDRASAEFEAIVAALDTALGSAPEWQDSQRELRGALLFSNEESALFSALCQGDEPSLD
jgi:hypothetical protein